MQLRAFSRRLEQDGRLLRIQREVDPVHEAAALIRALRGRPVLLENVRGQRMPVASNLCASRDLVCAALGVQRSDLLAHLDRAAAAPEEPEVVDASAYRQLEADLTALPILTHYAEDGGPYIASGIAVARDAEHGLNASFHRAMVRAPGELVFRIVKRHLHQFMERGLTEVAFCVGNPIQVLLAAAMSVPLGQSELAIANALAETRLVELAGHRVPESELVFICELTREQADEGPFLDLTGTFDIVRRQPVWRVREIHARRDALYHALLPGDLEHELLMGMPREPTIFKAVAEVCTCLDVRVTPGGCSWLHGAVQIRKERPGDGRRAIEAAFHGHASMKHVFVVDEDIDISDPAQMEWAMATRFQAHRDLVVREGDKGSSLDPSADLATKATTKVGFDLTVPHGEDRQRFRRVPPPVAIDLDDYL